MWTGRDFVAKKNEAPHCCDASRVSMCAAGLIRTDDNTSVTGFATTIQLPRLERPGIEPGAAWCIKPAVDTIDTPQRLTFTRRRAFSKGIALRVKDAPSR